MHGGTKDDIRTAGQRNEVATLYCRCPLTGCADDGFFRLSFMGLRTDEIGFGEKNSTLAAALTSLSSIRGRGHKTYASGRKRTHGRAPSLPARVLF
jgi:hypothetical protein